MKSTITNHGARISMQVILSEQWQCTACGGKDAPCRVEIYYTPTGYEDTDAQSKFRHRACLAGDHTLRPNWEQIKPAPVTVTP